MTRRFEPDAGTCAFEHALRGRVALTVGVALVLVPTFAVRAQNGPHVRARLVLDATSCLEEGPLRDGVESRLGRAVFVEHDADADLRVRVDGEADRLRAEVTLVRGDRLIGTREVTGNCDALRRAVPIVVALTVDLEASVVRIEEPAAPLPAQAPAQVTPRPSSLGEGAHLAGALRVGASASLGLFPEPTAIVHVAGRLVPAARLALEVRAELAVPGTVRRGDQMADLWGATGALAFCACPLLRGDFRVELCAEVRGGVYHAAGRGFAPDQSSWGGLVELAASPRATLGVGPFELVVAASLGAPVAPVLLTVGTAGGTDREWARSGPVSGRLGLEVGLRTP